MRPLRALAGLCVFSLTATAADTITTTDGMKYTKALDGSYYPSAHVRPNGSVSPTPRAATGAPGCVCGDTCDCEAGDCPAKCPVTSAPSLAPAFTPSRPTGGCPGGTCPTPTTRRGLFR